MKTNSRAVLVLAAVAILPWTPGLAADYDPPIVVDEAPEYVPVEVGSGWYLRGDVAYLPERSYGDLNFGAAPVSVSQDNQYVFASLGVGYHLNDYLRGDINIGVLPGNKFDVDTGANTIHGENRGATAMVNGYIDLGTYVGITPYLGAGVGLFQAKREYDISGGASGSVTQYSFAYSLNAGLAYQISKNLVVDLGYQYLSAPDAEYASIDNSAYSVRKGVDDHQIKIGLRYDLW